MTYVVVLLFFMLWISIESHAIEGHGVRVISICLHSTCRVYRNWRLKFCFLAIRFIIALPSNFETLIPTRARSLLLAAARGASRRAAAHARG
jgi:hypothetical protein